MAIIPNSSRDAGIFSTMWKPGFGNLTVNPDPGRGESQQAADPNFMTNTVCIKNKAQKVRHLFSIINRDFCRSDQEDCAGRE
jgi:hypothetical protein